MVRCSLLFGLLASLAVAMAPAATAARVLDLVYSGNLDGELEPCGCTAEGDLGGLRRRASRIAVLRERHPDLVLLSAGGLFSASAATHRITNQFILRAMEQLDYDAIGLQWADLLYGEAFLRPTDLPWIASNWRRGDFRTALRLRRAQVDLAIFQWLDETASPYQALPAAERPSHNDPQQLRQALMQARAEGALTLLATTLEPERAVAELPLAQIDLLLAQSRYEHYAEPRLLGETLVLQAGSRGQRLAHLRVTLDAAGRIADWLHEVAALPASVADSPALEPWYADYSAALMQDYQQRIAGGAALPAAAPYAGAERCASCHQVAHQVWSASAHARAFAALETVNKTFDANCIGCHVVGFGQAGGFVEPTATPGLSNVQCESCHGPARAHAEDPAQRPAPIDANVCASCHNRAHSPGFAFPTYWPRIAHGAE